MSDGIEHDESGPGWPGMRLLRFELHNWGTFDRQVWRLDVAGGPEERQPLEPQARGL